MARDHARVYLSIWDDDDFRSLSTAAQHLYFVLLTSPEMNYAGVTDWRPNRISKRAGGWSAIGVEIAAQELSEQLYVVIDAETEEVLLRSLIRHDGLLEQPNMAVAVRKAWAAVASPDLRGVVVHELNRLREAKPDLKGWSKVDELLSKPSLNPSDRASFHPSNDPSGKGSVNPSIGPAPNPSGHPSEKGSAITAPSSRSTLPTPDPGLVVSELGGERQLPARASDGTGPPPDCQRHKNGNPTDEPCARCARIREWDEAQAERERQAAARRRLDCPDCDENGMQLDPSTALPVRRCDHPRTRRSA